MHLDRGIFHMYIQSDGLHTILDDLNTLTRQPSGTNDAPRDPLHCPIKLNPDQHGMIYVYRYCYVYSLARHNDHRKQQTLRFYVKIPPIVASYPLPRPLSLAWQFRTIQRFQLNLNQVFPNIFDSRFLTGFNSGFPNPIKPKVLYWIRLYFPN